MSYNMSMKQSLSSHSEIDVAKILDNGSFTPLQIFFIIIIALSIVLDGFDSQLLGFAIPSMMKDWGYSERSVFAYAVTASSLGMVFGSVFAGFLADTIGRRYLILITLAICGFSTMLMSVASNVEQVAIFRFFTGVGIGGALPVCTTLSAEFTPLRYRTMIVTASIVCVSLGGMLAGFFSKLVLVPLGWQQAFFIGGLLPLLLLVVLWFLLPESPKYLAYHKSRWPELQKLLLRMKRPTPLYAQFVEKSDHALLEKSNYSAFLSSAFMRNSIVIWFAFFFCMSAIYAVYSWLPTILIAHNIDAKIAGDGLTFYNIGGILGSLICAWAIARLGSLKALTIFAFGGVISILAVLLIDIHQQSTIMLILISLHGFFVIAVLSPLYALSAFLYPTSMRATGAATAAAFGRVGAIVAGLCGGFITGFNSYVLLLALAVIGVFIALICLKKHMPAIKK